MAPQGAIISSTVAPSLADTANVILYNVPCHTSVYVKSAVRMNSSGIAVNALADIFANSNVIGFCVAKPSATLCNIRVLGVTSTIFTGLDVTKEYFLSETIAGAIQTTAPTGSGNIVLKLGQPYSALEFLVLKGLRMERA